MKDSSNAEVLVAGAESAISAYQEWGAFELAEAVSADSVSAPDFGKPFSTYASGPGMSTEGCDSSGPTAKLRRAAENAASFWPILQFV